MTVAEMDPDQEYEVVAVLDRYTCGNCRQNNGRIVSQQFVARLSEFCEWARDPGSPRVCRCIARPIPAPADE